MKKNKPTKSSINSLTRSLIRVSRAIALIAVVFAAASVAQATLVDVTALPYGAVGNASTDNRTAIQNAIDSLALSGGTVYFPPGYYNVSGTLYLPSNVRLQGSGSTVYNTQIRLTGTQTALFEIPNGVSGIVFKDLTLVSISNSTIWPRNPSQTTDIRGEGTIGISLKAGNRGISDIVIENVRITQFTYGISATSANLNTDTAITDVKIRGYASDGNEYSLYTNTKGADNWDVQNMNVYPMFSGQNGIFLERSGDMRFLQLSCAGAGAGVCARLLDNGNLYFREMHVEGPQFGICAGSDCDPATNDTVVENSSVITIENSATPGEFHRATNLVSVNNRFWIDFGTPPVNLPPYTFIGTGANSTLKSCGNVWVSWNSMTHMSNTTVTIPSGGYPGLATTIQGCLYGDLTSVPVFNTGYEPDTQLSGDIDVTSPLYGATTASGDDDTAAFVAAIAAARSSIPKKRVFVPAGSYDIYSTLSLADGESILGDGPTSVINLKMNTSLFRVVNAAGPVSGITFRNLSLNADSTTETIGIEFANYSKTLLGAASDYQIQNVDFKNFGYGVWVGPVDGDLTNAYPMFDSVSIKDGDFIDNKTAILVQGGNASNWNLEDLRVDVPYGGDGVRIDGAGHVSTRNLSCTGTGTACQTIQRQSGTSIEALSATGVTNALVVRWENGWTQFPVTVRNSDLLAGVYFQGRIFLNSVNNTYPASLITDFPKEVRFGAYKEGDDNNVAYGELSDIFSCNDTFTDLFATQNTWAYSGTLLKPVTYCY